MRLRVGLVGAAALAATACGAAPSSAPPPWAAAHPDPSGMHFTDAQGLCAITVHYPNEAPGEIDWNGEQYIQRGRASGAQTAGTVVAHSGDWTVRQSQPGALLLVTPGATYDYHAGSHCGSNSAAPT